MQPEQVISELWRRTQAQDWAGVTELVAPDAVVDWPASSERITGRDNYVAVNREYPPGWAIRVLRVFGSGDQVVSEVEVQHASMGTFRAASLWTVRDSQVVAGTEYWITVGADESPDWRAAYVERIQP